MKIGALKALLRSYQDLLETVGESGAAQGVTKLIELLGSQDSADGSRLLAAWHKLTLSPDVNLHPEQDGKLGKISIRLYQLLVKASAKAAASDFERLIGILERCDISTLAQLVQEPKAKAAAKPKSLRSDRSLINSDLVMTYLRDLRNTANDNDAFDKSLAVLKSDKLMRLQEIRDVANQFVGLSLAKSVKKADALKEIKNHQAFNARQEARIRSHQRN